MRYAHLVDSDERRAVRGGQLSANLFDWISSLRLSAEVARGATYVGPRWIGIPSLTVR